MRPLYSRDGYPAATDIPIGRILLLNTANGGAASAWMLEEMHTQDKFPLAIVFNRESDLGAGAALGDIMMLTGFDMLTEFDGDVTAAIPNSA